MVKADTKEQQVQQKTRRGVQAAVRIPEKPVMEQAEEIRQGKQISEKTLSSPFLFAALGSIVGSLILYIMRKKEDASFVGLWAPTFLTLGVFFNILGISKKRE